MTEEQAQTKQPKTPAERVAESVEELKAYYQSTVDRMATRYDEATRSSAEAYSTSMKPLDERLTAIGSKVDAIDPALKGLFQTSQTQGDALKNVSTRMEELEKKGFVPEDSYYWCDRNEGGCGKPLLVTKDLCPGCGKPVDWETLMTPIVERNRKFKTRSSGQESIDEE